MRKIKVYIAGPYSHGDVVMNVRTAINEAEILISHGYIPIIPHLTYLWHFIKPHDKDFWLAYDRELLDLCDALLRIPGQSEGADKEVNYAIEKNIPVVYSVVELDRIMWVSRQFKSGGE